MSSTVVDDTGDETAAVVGAVAADAAASVVADRGADATGAVVAGAVAGDCDGDGDGDGNGGGDAAGVTVAAGDGAVVVVGWPVGPPFAAERDVATGAAPVDAAAARAVARRIAVTPATACADGATPPVARRTRTGATGPTLRRSGIVAPARNALGASGVLTVAIGCDSAAPGAGFVEATGWVGAASGCVPACGLVAL